MIKNKVVIRVTILLSMVVFLFSCTQVDIFAPKGEKGDKGDKGDQGYSAYEVWKQQVAKGAISWPKDEVAEIDFFKYLKGKDGKDGVDGKDGTNGKSAYEVWKEYIATGDVDDPHNPGAKWDPSKNTVQDFWKFLTGQPGADGKTPYIKDGYWWIGDENLKIKAIGEDGKTPVVEIGENGNWYIDGVDTQRPARGEKGEKGDQGEKGDKGDKGDKGQDGKDGQDGQDGQNGSSGKTAYELWVEEVTNNCGKTTQVMNPHKPTEAWPCDKISLMDFFEYLRGKDGQDGVTPGVLVKGKPNVLAQYYNQALDEYVDPADGSVTFWVFDKEGASAPQGATVKGLPGIPNQTFVTDANGKFKVPANLLPDNLELIQRKGAASEVTINGETMESAQNTIVPNRINTRITANLVYLRQPTAITLGGGSYPLHHFTAIDYKYERQVDGQWVAYPDLFPEPDFTVVKVNDPLQSVTEANITEGAAIDKWRSLPQGQANSSFFADYNQAKNLVLIVRPIVLTDNERLGSIPQPSVSDYIKRYNLVKQYVWDNQKNYFSIRGSKYFYGQKPILPQAIHVPEIYPAPEFKTGTKIEVVEGKTTLWGELNIDNLNKAYVRYTLTGNVWEATLEEGSAIKTKYMSKITARIFMHRQDTPTSFYQSYTDIPFSKNHSKFALLSSFDGSILTLSLYIGDDAKGKTTQAVPNDLIRGAAFAPYRAVPYYKVKKTGNDYFLSYFYHYPTTDISLPQENVPTGWIN